MSEHSKGRLQVEERDGEIQLWAMHVENGVTNRECVAVINGPATIGAARADGRRLAACWNVFDVISTEDLERGGFEIRSQLARITIQSGKRQLEKDSEELLVALKNILEAEKTSGEQPTVEQAAAMNSARALLAKHTPKVAA